MRGRKDSHKLAAAWLAAAIGRAEFAFAGVCEELLIPMETLTIPDVGTVCIVKQAAGAPQLNDRGKPLTVKCDQGKFDPHSYEPKTDFCPVELGKCIDGRCVPRTESSWFETHFGTKWDPFKSFPQVTVTHYGGSMAGGGFGDHNDVEDVAGCFEKIGIDGVAAVPPMMFGSTSTKSQAIFKNNNLCYKLTGMQGYVRIVAIMDKCGGYTFCEGGNPEAILSEFPNIPNPPLGSGEIRNTDANQCFSSGERILGGQGQRCTYFYDGTPLEGKGTCCPGACNDPSKPHGLHADWCASQSHVHFDVSRQIINQLCGEAGTALGSCQLRSVEAIKCPLHPTPGRCCEASNTETCVPKTTGNCADTKQTCDGCTGRWIAGDAWQNICDDLTPSVPPDSTRPTDDPGATMGTTPGTRLPPVTTQPVLPPTQPGEADDSPRQKTQTTAIAGAVAGALALLVGAGFLAQKHRGVARTLSGYFGDSAEGSVGGENREAFDERGSQDFAT